jgi:hypothetical protein
MGTKTTARAIYLSLALVLGATACGARNPIPCSDCDDAADDMQEDPVPDLPCGGADLMTDLYNCGSCGNACSQWFPHTEWESGSCQDGVCRGPSWSHCKWKSSGSTCAEICAPAKCVPNGCSGHTALLDWADGSFDYCNVPPYATMDGPCDEPIPWEGDAWDGIYVMCCCG